MSSRKKKKLHVKKGDDVKVIAGNDKGKEGRVLAVFPKKDRVLVEGINMRVHHDKPSQQNPQGGRIEREAPVHISNVMVIDPNSGEPTRIGRKRIEEDGGGRWVRYAKTSGEIIDN
ncbi:50S ribosomal protein L24 [Aliifodinibius sp. S!AR15-10]|uniref:50S ribosomal protein L24 n=1 Tax=Aliifodinibius sp. S!AR15-10 TaxID=2950437 RepID=UPI0028594D05|nr:50S ribosomal protein L24 [Aliifodinibius sp. S!AR15-10]MDR8394509.1 50S ribosomal protein L24 [Aliifodinibius sp. S!AR15-10]